MRRQFGGPDSGSFAAAKLVTGRRVNTPEPAVAVEERGVPAVECWLEEGCGSPADVARKGACREGGHRWIDMRRTGKLAGIPLDRVGDVRHSTLPIPTDECLARATNPSQC